MIYVFQFCTVWFVQWLSENAKAVTRRGDWSASGWNLSRIPSPVPALVYQDPDGQRMWPANPLRLTNALSLIWFMLCLQVLYGAAARRCWDLAFQTVTFIPEQILLTPFYWIKFSIYFEYSMLLCLFYNKNKWCDEICSFTLLWIYLV